MRPPPRNGHRRSRRSRRSAGGVRCVSPGWSEPRWAPRSTDGRRPRCWPRSAGCARPPSPGRCRGVPHAPVRFGHSRSPSVPTGVIRGMLDDMTDATAVPADHPVFWTTGAAPEAYLIDMDGVLLHESTLIPGADAFIHKLREANRKFLVLTNNSIYTPRDLRARLIRAGIDVPTGSLWTSALATAQFLDSQRPGGTAHAIGEAGLTTALHDVGYVLTEVEPDYVVLGETRTY